MMTARPKKRKRKRAVPALQSAVPVLLPLLLSAGAFLEPSGEYRRPRVLAKSERPIRAAVAAAAAMAVINYATTKRDYSRNNKQTVGQTARRTHLNFAREQN